MVLVVYSLGIMLDCSVFKKLVVSKSFKRGGANIFPSASALNRGSFNAKKGKLTRNFKCDPLK